MAIVDHSREGALKETSLLETVGLVVGVLGGTATLFGGVLYAIDPSVAELALVNMLCGLVGLLFYGVTNRRQLGRAIRGRSTSLVALEVAIGLGVLAGLVGVNVLGSRSDVGWDLTQDRLYTLEEQSQRTAEKLTVPVRVVGFLRANEPARARLLQVVELYTKINPKIQAEIVNPDSATPALLKEFQMTATSPRIVVVAEGGRMTKIRQPTEEAITNALIKVVERAAPEVAFLRGHEEPSFDDDKTATAYGRSAGLLRDEGYTVVGVSLIEKDAIPPSVSVLVVAPTRSPLLVNEVAALTSYVERGGRLVILLDPVLDSGLGALFTRLSIEVGDDLVVDLNPTSKALGFGPDAPVIQKFEAHPITDRLENTFVMFYGVRSVMPKLGVDKVRLATLIRSSEESWAETRYREETDAVRDEQDVPGPVPVAIAATMETMTHPSKLQDEARVVVFGDGNFVDNRFSTQGSNADLFLNAVNWARGDEQRITVRPKSRGSSRLALTEAQHYGVMFFSVNFLPFMIIGLGFSIWAVRRRR